MAKRLPIRAGDVVVIPLSQTQAVLGKILYLHEQQFKGLLMVGVATDRLFDPRKPPEPRVATWQLVKFTYRKGIDDGIWKLHGHDPTPISPDALLRIYCGGVFRGEKLVRHASKADNTRLPHQSMGSHLASEIGIRAELGMRQPPLPWEQPKKAAAKPAAPKRGVFAEARFWSMIDAAWTSAAARMAGKRPGIAAKVSQRDADALSKALDDKVVPALAKALGKLTREQLIGFDRMLERKLYEIDRADVQRHTDGSDDGFLYARGFIVGMGRRYFDLVREDPSRAIIDMEDEGITYLPHRVFEERFDEDLPRSDISRETGSNKAGWR